MAAKFPVNPTSDEKTAFLDFIYLFARLYPCGDCAKHFQGVLRQVPPNVDSRDDAVLWACTAHNVVNERLKKPIFDCKRAAEAFGCGCGTEEGEKGKAGSGEEGKGGGMASRKGGSSRGPSFGDQT
ncbi:hypothetical protein HK104_007875 [Borealophlyctis nickersoniae]|nr:hypothetical protein HK104_007875 [Borealophlyctis nickersoniae]